MRVFCWLIVLFFHRILLCRRHSRPSGFYVPGRLGRVSKAAHAAVFLCYRTSRLGRFSYDPSYDGHSRWFTMSDGAVTTTLRHLPEKFAGANPDAQGLSDPELLPKSSKRQDFSINRANDCLSNLDPCIQRLFCFHL
jgi:hypothetical protein